MGYFSELREAFKTFADISATQASLITELNELKAKPVLTSAEQARYNQIVSLLSDNIVSAEDINNIQKAIVNIETFLDNQPLYFRGEYNANTTYANCDVVYYYGSAYVCLKANTKGIIPTADLSRWKLFVKQGISAQLITVRKSVEVTSNVRSVNIGIAQYDRSRDCLVVYKNGLFLNEGTDYTINAAGTVITKLGGDYWEGASDYKIVFDFCVFKNAYALEFDVNEALIINGGTSAGI